MQVENRVIYHCQSCGKVVHCPMDAKSPSCCGREMPRAAAETIGEVGIDVSEKAECECVPLPIRVQPKPR